MPDSSDHPNLDLPDPENRPEEKIVSDIRQYGWHCLTVAPRADPSPESEDYSFPDTPFAYTIGLPLTLAHPELILVGGWVHAHPILSTAVALIREGRHFTAGDQTNEILERRLVRFGQLTDRYRLELLTFSDWATRRRGFEALQLVVADEHGRWPDDPDYTGINQPSLAR